LKELDSFIIEMPKEKMPAKNLIYFLQVYYLL